MCAMIFAEAAPSPNAALHGRGEVRLAARELSRPRRDRGEDPLPGRCRRSTLPPPETVSTHSVSSRSVTQGLPRKNASFCRPPESVSTMRARATSAIMSR